MIPGKLYTLKDCVAIAARRKWLIVLPFVTVAIATYLVARSLPNRYRSETLILVVPQRVPESYVRSTVTARIEDRLQSISQQILSRTRLERIIIDSGLYARKRRAGVIMEDVVEQMRKDIDVQVIKGDAFRVSFTGEEPRTAMQVTERLATLFIDENLRDREMLAEGSYQFLEAQLEDARRRLVEHEKKLEEYRRRYSGQLPSQFQSNLQVIQNTQMQIQALTESMARDRDRRLAVERAMADAVASDDAAPPTVPAAVSLADNLAGSGTAAQQLEAARQALRQMELHLTAEHPDVARMKRAIATLEQKAAVEAEAQKAHLALGSAPPSPQANPAEVARQNRRGELKIELESLDRQLARKEDEEKRLRQIVADYQARLEATPARESELTELMRDYDTLQKGYTTLLTKKEDSKVAANLERNQIGEQFKVLDPARMPEKPESPDRLRIDLLGALCGLMLGAGLVGVLELSDSTLKTDDDVMHALAMPVLALVPLMVTRRERQKARRQRVLFGAASATAVVAVLALIAWKLAT